MLLFMYGKVLYSKTTLTSYALRNNYFSSFSNKRQKSEEIHFFDFNEITLLSKTNIAPRRKIERTELTVTYHNFQPFRETFYEKYTQLEMICHLSKSNCKFRTTTRFRISHIIMIEYKIFESIPKQIGH